LKDDVAFALLIAISPHTGIMFNELNNISNLDELNNVPSWEARWVRKPC
jgi:hypothetical protein